MKYFLDTEFIEGFHKPMFGKRRHFIDLISIGIVSEDNRALYFISSEYNYNDADPWVKENVILPAYINAVHGDNRNRYSSENFHRAYGISNKRIAKEVMAFVNPCSGGKTLNDESWNKHLNKFSVVASENRPIEFYGYYCDYDWVLFCSLFGRMIDLPKGFPMYCRDIKQMMDEKGVDSDHKDLPVQKNNHISLHDAAWNKEAYKYLLQI